MPKEKVTRGKGKATKAEGGKKKKGKSFACILLSPINTDF
jgi:hypothetical protein